MHHPAGIGIKQENQLEVALMKKIPAAALGGITSFAGFSMVEARAYPAPDKRKGMFPAKVWIISQPVIPWAEPEGRTVAIMITPGRGLRHSLLYFRAVFPRIGKSAVLQKRDDLVGHDFFRHDKGVRRLHHSEVSHALEPGLFDGYPAIVLTLDHPGGNGINGAAARYDSHLVIGGAKPVRQAVGPGTQLCCRRAEKIAKKKIRCKKIHYLAALVGWAQHDNAAEVCGTVCHEVGPDQDTPSEWVTKWRRPVPSTLRACSFSSSISTRVSIFSLREG